MHFQPDDSPVRKEVKDLWTRRKEKDVVDQLSAFKGQQDADSPMLFHNAVMRWKCSLLSEDERHELQAWTERDVEKKWDAIQHPWRVCKDEEVDDLTAENQFIQE